MKYYIFELNTLHLPILFFLYLIIIGLMFAAKHIVICLYYNHVFFNLI